MNLHAGHLGSLVSLALICASDGAESWSIVDLGIISGWRVSLNDAGWAVFDHKVLSPGASGYSTTAILSSAGNSNNFSLFDINNTNTVLGVDRSVGNATAFVWQSGTRTDLPQLANFTGYTYATAIGINDSGQIAGNTGDYAHLWTPVGAGGYTTTALGVDLGWTIGSGESMGINNAGVTLLNQVYNFYRTGYSIGATSGLTTIIPDQGAYTPVGQAISDTNAVVGYFSYTLEGYTTERPFYWDGSTVTTLPVDSPWSPNGVARAMNEQGMVVGDGYYDAYDQRAYLWTFSAGTWEHTDLNTLLPVGSEWSQLLLGTDINESGQIAGVGSISGQPHAFIMTPYALPEPAACAMLASLAMLGFAVVPRRFARIN